MSYRRLTFKRPKRIWPRVACAIVATAAISLSVGFGAGDLNGAWREYQKRPQQFENVCLGNLYRRAAVNFEYAMTFNATPLDRIRPTPYLVNEGHCIVRRSARPAP